VSFKNSKSRNRLFLQNGHLERVHMLIHPYEANYGGGGGGGGVQN
jgi:hypothetical protein